jgi:hypothetical protein
MKPIQLGSYCRCGRGQVNDKVYLKAYEVYVALYGEQKALIEGSCRGGFGETELIAFLYASGFPKSEWSDRVQEAFEDMKIHS